MTHATLSTAPAACYSSPARVPIGGGFTAEVPDGAGTIVQCWQDCADHTLSTLNQLDCGHIDYRRHDAQLLEVRIYNNLLPITTLLTHPKTVSHFRTMLETLVGETPAVYIDSERVFVCGQSTAKDLAGFRGPFDLSTGYCVPLVL